MVSNLAAQAEAIWPQEKPLFALADITVDYVVVDPLRVPGATFAAIWGAWRDGLCGRGFDEHIDYAPGFPRSL